MQDLEKFKNEMNLSGQNVYVGHRYVPKIMGEWDNKTLYEPLSIVQYQGASYTSRQYVPVGVELTNEEFWVVTGNYNAQVEQYRIETLKYSNAVQEYISDVTSFKDELDKHVEHFNIANVKHFGALGDGLTDDSDAFITALNTLKEKANNGILIIPKTTAAYILNKDINLEFNDNFNLLILGEGSTLKRTSENGGFILRLASKGNAKIEIKDLKIDGIGVPENWDETVYNDLNSVTGIHVNGFNTVKMDNVKIENCYGYGIKIFDYDYVSLDNINTNHVGGKWSGGSVETYDAFGDSIYVARANSEKSKAFVLNSNLKGYDRNDKLSRVGVTFEFGAGYCEVRNTSINGYERPVHSEDVAEIDLNLNNLTIERYGVIFHMGDAKKIRLSKITLRECLGSFNSYKGMFTLWNAGNIKDILIEDITVYMNSNMLMSGGSGNTNIQLSNIHLISADTGAYEYRFTTFKGSIDNSIVDNNFIWLYNPRENTTLNDVTFINGNNITEGQYKRLGLRVTGGKAPDINDCDFLNAYLFIENAAKPTFYPEIKNTHFKKTTDAVFSNNDSRFAYITGSKYIISNTNFEGSMFDVHSNSQIRLGGNYWLKDDGSITLLTPNATV